MFLVIATSLGGRIIAIEQSSDTDDSPPAPTEIIGRWLTQRVIGSKKQVQVWTDEGGWYYSPVDGIPGER